jgi:hypothetical protein
VKNTKTTKEAYTFLGLSLVLSWFVFWGTLALFKIPTISFVSNVKVPLLAILATTFVLMVSSRVNCLRVAEQISMVIIIPALGVFFGQVSGLFVLSTQLISVVAFVMLALDVLMLYLASQVFDNESILTRWR